MAIYFELGGSKKKKNPAHMICIIAHDSFDIDLGIRKLTCK